MSKLCVVALVLAALVCASVARESSISLPKKIGVQADDEVCDLCLQSMVNYINVLLNEGIGEGSQTCDELCRYRLPPHLPDLRDIYLDKLHKFLLLSGGRGRWPFGIDFSSVFR